MHDPIGRAFPYHGIVLAEDPFYFFRQKRHKLLKRLEKIGYEIDAKKGSALSNNWGHEAKRELLKSIRRKGLVDPRIRQIVDTIRENIGADAYTFVHYKPRAKFEIVSGHYRHLVETGHRPTLCVFELSEDRIESHQAFYTCDLSAYGGYGNTAVATAAGIASTLKTPQGKRHIPMIAVKDAASRADVEFDLDRLAMPGMIVESGNSYHFYGFEPLSESDWRDFIGETGKLHAIDKNWTQLQTEQGYSMLRITPAYNRLFQPCVVKTRPRASGETQREIKLAA